LQLKLALLTPRLFLPHSGSISFNEAHKALSNFGYRLSEPIMQLMFYSYDADRTGALGFDEFVQMNSELSSMTNMFRRHDAQGTGVATINYEQFLSMVLTLKASDE
jgi:calcium-binding protein CML